MKRRNFLLIQSTSLLHIPMISSIVMKKQGKISDETVSLQQGETIGCICTGDPVTKQESKNVDEYFKNHGFHVELGKHVTKDYLFGLAGTDAERLEDLNRMLRNPSMQAIVIMTGEYGSLPLLPEIDYEALIKHPKWIIGTKDATCLHMVIYRQNRGKSLYAPAFFSSTSKTASFQKLEQYIWTVLQKGDYQPIEFNPAQPWEKELIGSRGKRETVTGTLLGGNLSRLAGLCGTPYALPMDEDIVLFLEEKNEYAYRIDRYLTQLKESGAFTSVKGIIIGDFIAPRVSGEQKSVYQVLVNFIHDLNIPVLAGLPKEMQGYKMVFVHGANVKMDMRMRRIQYY